MCPERKIRTSLCAETLDLNARLTPGRAVNHSRQTVHICGIVKLPLKRQTHNNVWTSAVRSACINELQSAEVTGGAVKSHFSVIES